MQPLPTIPTCLWLILFLFLGTIANAQTEKDTLLAWQHYQKADSLLTARKHEASIENFKKALPIYENAKAWERVASCYNKISYALWYDNYIEKSLENANQALSIDKQYLSENNREKAHAYDNIGRYHQDKYDFDTSLDYFNKALDLRRKIFSKHHQDIALSFENIGLLNYDLGNFVESLKYYQNALAIRILIYGEQHPITSESYYTIGITYSRQGKYKKAIEQYHKSLNIRELSYGKNHALTSKVYNHLGYAYMVNSEYTKAENYLKSALITDIKNYGEQNSSVATSYYSLADLYRRIGNYESSIDNFEKSLKIYRKVLGEDAINVANTYYSLGLVQRNMGFYDIELNCYQKALKIFLEKKSTHPTVSIIYSGIGNVFLTKGAYKKALQYYKKGLDVALKSVGKNHYLTGTIYANIALIYKHLKNYNEALLYNDKSLKIRTTIFDKDHPKIAEIYTLTGDIYLLKKKYTNSYNYYQKAINIYSDKFKEPHPDIAIFLNKIGVLKQKMGLYDEALSYFKRSLKIRKNIFSENSSFIAESCNHIAETYLIQKNYENALKYYQKSIISNTVSNTRKQFFDQNILLSALNGLAKTYKKLYQQNKTIEYLKNTNTIYQKADTLTNAIRQSFSNYQDKVSFAKQAKEVYQGAIETELLFYKVENNPKNLNKAFFYLERSKANTLKELLNDANAKHFTGLSSNLIELEKNLRINKVFYQSKITNTQSDSIAIVHCENKLFEIDRRQDSLTSVLEQNYPKYYQLKYQNDVISVANIQNKLDEQTTLLEFFTSDSSTYAFTVSKNNIAVQELSTPDLADHIKGFRTHIESKRIEDFKKSAATLYQTLIAPVTQNLIGDQLIIVPDGPLWHLNFELLLTQEEDSNNPKEWSYLLKDYAIAYANSANLLFTPSYHNDTNKKQEECLAFSFTDSTSMVDTKTMSLATLRDAGDDLPGTRKEIKAISEIIDGQYYFGSEAIETNFKKNANKYTILHLALHGEVDNERPENSKLYFTKSKDTIEDGFLYGHELFALDIPAELTVLSACSTGAGKIAKGEGIMSLGTAFQYAGTKSLLLTSWNVSDQTTPELMKHFYTHLKTGMNKAKALQQAKLQYLQTADINRVHPFYWGGFYLVGDSAPMHFSTNWWYWVLGLAALGVLILVVFWYRKKPKK